MIKTDRKPQINHFDLQGNANKIEPALDGLAN
jgi:hypothetical protein